MKILKRLFFAIFPITSLSNISNASLVDVKFDFVVNENRTNLDHCSRLLELEQRSELDSEEWEEGAFIHQLVNQISEQPLDYCMQLTSMDFLVDRQER
jgi:hypothetical protein